MPRHRSIRGNSMIEALIAGVIMIVAIVAMFAAWQTCFKQNKSISEVTQAEEIDRAILETAKVYGPLNLPVGTFNTTTQLGTWSGAYIPATGWTSGATAYFDVNGAQLASSTSAGVYYSASVTITDTGASSTGGTTYVIQNSTLRSVVATVTRVSDGTAILPMATNLIVGGM
jgi:Tfp pilus assembly protein PilV